MSAGIESAVRLYIARGDSLEARDDNGLTPLLIAAARNRPAICKMLLDAGADPSATDKLGRSALSMAVAKGSTEAARVIEGYLENSLGSAGRSNPVVITTPGQEDEAAPTTPLPSQIPHGSSFSLQGERVFAGADSEDLCSVTPDQEAVASPKGCDVLTEPDQVAESLLAAPGLPPLPLHASEDSGFGDWEPIQRRVPPPDNPSVMRAESERQHEINLHSPIDRGASWEEFDAYLPEQARPLPRADDPGLQQSIRTLFRRAVREGSVPRVSIEDVLSERGDGEARDEDTEALLEFIIGDLGGDIDERLEFRSRIPSENFEVTFAEDESQDEESQLDAALQHFEELRSGNNNPLRIYSRSAASHPLLTPDQESSLAKEMEAAVERALDALSRWRDGVTYLIDEFKRSRHEAIALGRIVVTAPSPTPEIRTVEADAGIDGLKEDADPDETEPDQNPPTNSDSQGVTHDEVLPYENPEEVIDWIVEFGDWSHPTKETSELRTQLGRLRFRRPFLISLADKARPLDPEGATPYREAIADLLAARSRMAGSNLRLVLDLARRYQRSGAAIEDLIQDGNLGLLTAVDRFDWRRGFRFSTMATWWIKQSITRNLADKLSMIRLPVHIQDRVNHGLREIEATERQRGTPLSIMEKAAVSGLSVKRFEAAIRALSEPISIEQAEFERLLATDLPEDPFETVATRERAGFLGDLLSILGSKDQRVMRMRYGIGVNDEMTLEQVGQRLGLTRERIRQIEARAFKRLTSNHRIGAISAALGRRSPDSQVHADDLQADE